MIRAEIELVWIIYINDVLSKLSIVVTLLDMNRTLGIPQKKVKSYLWNYIRLYIILYTMTFWTWKPFHLLEMSSWSAAKIGNNNGLPGPKWLSEKQATFVTKFGPVPIQSTVRCCFGGVSSKTHRKIDTSSSKIEIQWLSVLIIWSLFLQVRPFERPFNTYIIIYKSYIYIIILYLQLYKFIPFCILYTIFIPYDIMSRRKNCSGLARRLPEPAPGLELSAAPARGSNEEIWEAHFGVWIFFRRKEDWETFRLFFYMFYTCLPCLSRSSICVSEASLFALPCFFFGWTTALTVSSTTVSSGWSRHWGIQNTSDRELVE